MAIVNDPRHLAHEQYQNSHRLDTRIHLHERFTITHIDWFRWLFAHLTLPRYARVLELGCGTGTLWLRNLDCLPFGWSVHLSDLSAGMVRTTRTALRHAQHAFHYTVRCKSYAMF